QASDEVIGILLQSVDILRGLLGADADAAMPPEALELDARIKALTPAEPVPAEAAPEEPPQVLKDAPAIKLYHVEFRPDRELFASGTNPIVLLRNLAGLGTVRRCQLHA